MNDSNPMSQIKHVVYYMLENRSFDNVLGWLYDSNKSPQEQGIHILANAAQRNLAFMGLQEDKYFNRFLDGKKYYVQRGLPTNSRCQKNFATPSPDPHEEYGHVNTQIFYPQVGNETCCGDAECTATEAPADLNPTMGGFLANYETARKFYLSNKTIDREQAKQILHTYEPQDLSVLSALARSYAVSDYWFSSVPTQTTPNRAFSLCGQSDGQVNNHGAFFGLEPSRFQAKPIWRVLWEEKKDKDWMIYHQHLYPSWVRHLGPRFYSYTRDAFDVPSPGEHFAHIEDFFQAAEAGELPSFSYIEPDWAGIVDILGVHTYRPNSYHPPSEVGPGEQFLKRLFEALTGSEKARKAWEQTLLIINFDEHGGTYDHVRPPSALPPTESGPGQCGFRFDRFGVRVPALLISPLIEERTVFRSMTEVPYDHTSVLATLLDWKGIPKETMGKRVANAPTFETVLTRVLDGKGPRKDLPELEVHAPLRGPLALDQMGVSDLQGFVLPRMLHQLAGGKIGTGEAEAMAREVLKKASLDAGFPRCG